MADRNSKDKLELAEKIASQTRKVTKKELLQNKN